MHRQRQPRLRHHGRRQDRVRLRNSPSRLRPALEGIQYFEFVQLVEHLVRLDMDREKTLPLDPRVAMDYLRLVALI